MYIQNAAQWYNLNSISCKQISMIRKKSNLLKHFSQTRNSEIKAIATNSNNWTLMQLLKGRMFAFLRLTFQVSLLSIIKHPKWEVDSLEKNEGRTPYLEANSFFTKTTNRWNNAFVTNKKFHFSKCYNWCDPECHTRVHTGLYCTENANKKYKIFK